MYRYVLPIILAGGKSSRAGNQKSLLKIKKIYFLNTLLNFLFDAGFLKIVISGSYIGYNYKQDIINNLGPLISLKIIQETFKNFSYYMFIPTDMPFIKEKIFLNNIFFLKKKCLYYNSEIFPILIFKSKNILFLIKIKFITKKISIIKFLIFTKNKFAITSFVSKKNFLNINTFLEYFLKAL